MTIEEFTVLCKSLNWDKLREALVCKTFTELPCKILISVLMEAYAPIPAWRHVYGLSAYWDDRLYNIPTNKLMIQGFMAVNIYDFYKAFHLTKIFISTPIEPRLLQTFIVNYVQTHKFQLAELMINYLDHFKVKEIQEIRQTFGDLSFSSRDKERSHLQFQLQLIDIKEKSAKKITILEKQHAEISLKIEKLFELKPGSCQASLRGLEKMKCLLHDGREYREMDEALSLPPGQSLFLKIKYFSIIPTRLRFTHHASHETIGTYAQHLKALGLKLHFICTPSILFGSISSIEIVSTPEETIQTVTNALARKYSVFSSFESLITP